MKNKIAYVGNEHTNFSGRKGTIPDTIVNHISQGSKESCIDWFTSVKNTQSSAHFLVCKNGDIYQFVKIEDMAWSNGLYLEDIKKAKSLKVKNRNINPNRYTISIEHEGLYESTEGELTEKQLNSSICLHKHIIDYVYNKYKKIISVDRKNIIGHYEIDPIRKPYCPGEKFPFKKIIKKIKEERFFTDIESHWAKKDIVYLAERKIMKGYPDNSFRPEKYITRGEIANILCEIIKG